jgi:alcohol dehydrogenase class IV
MESTKLFQTTSRIVMGPGAIKQICEEIKRLNGTRVTIITDAGLVKSGIVNTLEQLLSSAGLSFSRFDNVEPDPPLETAVEAARFVRAEGSDFIVGIGGGSPLDIAKVAAVLGTDNDDLNAYFGVDLVPGKWLPTILVPTTAGTGSEVTPIAILSDNTDKLKKGVVSPYLFPEVALLDPELTIGLPASVTAASGMDALIHAVEAYTSKNATPLSNMMAREAMGLIFRSLRTAYADGGNLKARTNMLEGSLLAGMAFANAGVTAVHAFAYPIGAEFHIPHGVANSIMLIPVMEFNMMGILPKLAEVASIFGLKTSGLNERQSALETIEALRILADDLRLPKRLSAFGITDEHIPALAEGVMKVTRLLDNNPRHLAQADAEEIYRRVL